MTQEIKNNIEIILVEPSEPGNIGSTARAMHNMGFLNLGLVNPVEYKIADTYRFAWNSKEIVDNAKVYTSLSEAVADKGFVIAMSTRQGKDRGFIEVLNDFKTEIIQQARTIKTAILFGRESWGLTNEELQFANKIVRIHTAGLFTSLNLSQAVLVTCYELLCACGTPVEERPKSAPREELEQCFEHVERILHKIGYGTTKGDPCMIESIMKNVRRIAGKALLESVEIRMFRGICSQIEKFNSDLA